MSASPFLAVRGTVVLIVAGTFSGSVGWSADGVGGSAAPATGTGGAVPYMGGEFFSFRDASSGAGFTVAWRRSSGSTLVPTTTFTQVLANGTVFLPSAAAVLSQTNTELVLRWISQPAGFVTSNAYYIQIS